MKEEKTRQPTPHQLDHAITSLVATDDCILASLLLCTVSLHQRMHCYLSQHYIARPPTYSWTWHPSFDLTDAQLLTHLTALAPHSQPWQMLHAPPNMLVWLTANL